MAPVKSLMKEIHRYTSHLSACIGHVHILLQAHSYLNVVCLHCNLNIAIVMAM